VAGLTPDMTADAFRAEAAALRGVLAGLTDADLDRPSPCLPWTIAGLLCHVIIATDRVRPAIEAAGRAHGELVTAAGYYRPDERFSATVNADRIDIAAALAARLGTVAAIRAELTTAAERTLAILVAAPAGQLVGTRHGDRMLLSEFAVTRVVELGVHGLDLAAGLDREPWLTSEATVVLIDLLLPGGASTAQALCAGLACDRTGLITRLTGRVTLSATDSAVLAQHGLTRLALG
jgi:uncharacterized protein (TIGR03083 family)